MTAATAPVRCVQLADGIVPVGHLAGTTTPHEHAPDGKTGSSCLACYGWADDPRHLTTPTLPTVGIGGWRRG